MLRRCSWFGAAVLALGIAFLGETAQAVIPADFSLQTAIKSTAYFTATVEKLDATAKPPRMVLKPKENIKKPGEKLPWATMRVLMEGDAKAKKLNHPELLLKRLAPGLEVIVFANRTDKSYFAFVYTNGTWFHIYSQKPDSEPWELTHGQPALRGTFKGTTEELRKTLRAILERKMAIPKPNDKEPPGFGPEVKSSGALPMERSDRFAQGASTGGSTGPVFAVIPTVAIGGPLAILAALFPSLFGKPKEILRRYLALLTVMSVNSIAYLVHMAIQTWGSEVLRVSAWSSPLALWLVMAVVTLLGTVWSWRRVRAARKAGVVDGLVPTRGEVIVFEVLSLVGLVLMPYALGAGELFDPRQQWREMLVAFVVIWAGTLGAIYLRRATERDARPKLPLEGVMLGALTAACVGMIGAFWPRSVVAEPPTVTQLVGDDQTPPRDLGRQLEDAKALFTPDDPGTLDSTPLVTADRIYLAVAHRAGFSTYGRLYCLDRASHKPLWVFNNNGEMKQVYSSPCLANGRLYVGEGYHQDSACKLFCIDAQTGKKVWEFPTKSHTESSPAVVDGKVYFGAGDDGVYCLDAATGTECWHFEGLHVDTRLAVANGKVYGGSGGYGKPTTMFCLDAASGARVWETPSRLPVFGSPRVFGKRVFFGTGTGNLVQSDAKPAGALVCLNAANGDVLWQFDDVKDAVHTQPAVDRQHVYFGSRDKHVYCVGRADGQLRWKANLGSPVVAAPALGLCACCGNTDGVYAVASGGRVACLDSDNGTLLWQPFEVGVHSQKTPQLLSAPVVVTAPDGRRQVYVGTGLDALTEWNATLYCLQDRPAARR